MGPKKEVNRRIGFTQIKEMEDDLKLHSKMGQNLPAGPGGLSHTLKFLGKHAL